jgi:hypothetical protein
VRRSAATRFATSTTSAPSIILMPVSKEEPTATPPSLSLAATLIKTIGSRTTSIARIAAILPCAINQ